MEYVRQEAWNEVENALDVAELLFNRQVELEMRDAPDNEQLLDRAGQLFSRVILGHMGHHRRLKSGYTHT